MYNGSHQEQPNQNQEQNQEQKEEQKQEYIDTSINDVRSQKEFQDIGFSGHKKTDVKKELMNALIQSNHEPACYWSAELICAGHYYETWEIFILFFCKYIHISNPKLCIYLKKRWLNFKSLLTNGYTEMELFARNDKKIRNLYCEVVCVLCNSNKNHLINGIKISEADFEVKSMQEKLVSEDVIHINHLFRTKDPRELFMAYNEFFYHLQNKHPRDACYWMEWIMSFERKLAMDKNSLKSERRNFQEVETKYQTDVVWMIWDAFFNEAIEKSISTTHQIIQSCLSLFAIKYTSSRYNKYKLMMYFLIQVLTEPEMQSMKTEVIPNKQILPYFLENLNHIYAQIKKNERSPRMEYLHTEGTKSNLSKTIENIEMMNEIGF
jgi:hypothetical protein